MTAEAAGGGTAAAVHWRRILAITGREVWYMPGCRPACFLLVDARAGGVLVNSPPYSAAAAAAIGRVAPVSFVFYPSRLGATDVGAWRSALRARTIAAAAEARDIAGPIDEPVDSSVRLYGRLDFLHLPGRTRGTCALRSRVTPGVIFLGPALDHTPWPSLVAHCDDHSAEDRLIGALALRDERFEYAFCDDYRHGVGCFGPGAYRHVAAAIDAAVNA